MGLIGKLFGFLGTGSAQSVAEVFVPNKTAREANEHAEQVAVLQQFATEFARQNRSAFDSLIDGINRLPRPLMAFGTIWLFVYALRDPVAFAERMVGLQTVPEPLWWLLGAIVSFYFGARELQHFRKSRDLAPSPGQVGRMVSQIEAIRALRPDEEEPEIHDPDNPAVVEWRHSTSQ